MNFLHIFAWGMYTFLNIVRIYIIIKCALNTISNFKSLINLQIMKKSPINEYSDNLSCIVVWNATPSLAATKCCYLIILGEMFSASQSLGWWNQCYYTLSEFDVWMAVLGHGKLGDETCGGVFDRRLRAFVHGVHRGVPNPPLGWQYRLHPHSPICKNSREPHTLKNLYRFCGLITNTSNSTCTFGSWRGWWIASSHVAIVSHEDCHFKCQNWSSDAKVNKGSQSRFLFIFRVITLTFSIVLTTALRMVFLFWAHSPISL